VFGWLTKFFDSRGGMTPAEGFSAASKLAEVPTPTKLKAQQQASPSYLKTAKPSTTSALPRADRRLANTNLETYRTGIDSRQIIRDFAASSPDLSAAVNAYLRTAITAHYTAVAKNMDGTFNREATALLQQLLTRFDVVQDYEDGFSGTNSMRSNSESLGKELMLYGACSLELVLGKDRLPRTLQPVSTSQISFFPDKSGKWLSPKQLLSGTEIDLDIPTFFYTALDQDLLEPYASSPLEPALQMVLFSTEFMNDLRRIVKRAVHPRMTVKLDEEKFKKNIPPEALADTKKLAEYMAATIADIETKINTLNPEDVLVYFDTLGVDLLNNGNISLDAEYKTLNGIVDAKMTTGAKALPSILGHGSGSQNIASSETLLFMKNAAGSVQEKLNEIYSRALTLAVRLFGEDVYVEFRYAPIDLRPDAELEAFKVMRQSRTLELLSYGFITDDEASMQLTGQLTPAGFTPLAGTRFMQPVKADPNANPHSNSPGGKGGGPQDKKSDAPAQPKGPVRAVK
jgi:hypothetical protein